MMRVCKKCGEEKPIEEFKGGRNKCKRCYVEYNKIYVETHPDLRARLIEYQREYRRKKREERIRQRELIPIKREKTCTKCLKVLPIDKFEIIKHGHKGNKQQYAYSARCIDCQEDSKLFKTCFVCKKRLPRTEEYFHVKLIKQQNKRGEAIYYSYKDRCRECHNAEMRSRHITEYWKDPLKARERSRRQYWKDPVKSRNMNNERRERNIDQYRKKDKKRVAELDDSWVASSMGIPLSEIPKDVLEIKKLTILLKREAGLTHTTKKQ